MRTVLGIRLAAGLLSLLLAPVQASGEWNPMTGCDVHLRRPAAANYNYHEICGREAVDALNGPGTYPDPSQYGDLSSRGDQRDWPLVGPELAAAPPSPDLGYRYPLVRIPIADPSVAKTQLLGIDEWPVCVSEDQSSVIATPARAGLGCPDGYARVGSCEASAHYYERLGTPIAS